MADYDSALPVRGAWKTATAITAGTDTLFPVMGSDGTNYYTLLTDNTGKLEVDTGLTMFSWNNANKVVITDGTDDLQVVVDGSAAGTNGIHLLGTDGTNAQILSTTSNGYLNVNATFGAGRANTVTYNSAVIAKGTPANVVTLAGAKEVVKVQAGGSGKMKIDVKYGTTGSEATIATLFNSTANPNVEYTFPDGLAVASGETILLFATNLEAAASPSSDFTIYGSIMDVA